MRRLAFVAVLLLAGSAVSAQDRLLIDKSERALYVMSQGRVFAEIPVRLGLVPEGNKQREGDFRTPEGEYQLVNRNPDSRFFLSLEISYPNTNDLLRAEEADENPGGEIMIHGWPNERKYGSEYYSNIDWTDGCIAISNPDMVRLWSMVNINMPVSIVP